MISRLLKSAWNNPWLLIFLCLAFWASNVVAARLAAGNASAMVLGSMRWFVSSAIMLPIVWRQIVEHKQLIRENWMTLISLSGFSIYSLIFYAAGNFTSGVNISMLVATVPVFTIVIAWIFLRIPVGPVVITGVILTVLGAIVVASRGDLSVLRNLSFNKGDLLILGASILHASFTVGLRSRPPFPPMVFFTLLAVIALLTSIPAVAVEVATGQFIWPTWLGIAILLYVGTFPTILSQSFYMRVIELIGPQRTSLFYNMVPIMGAMMSVAFLGEAFQFYHFSAFVLVLSGIALAEGWRARQERLAAKRATNPAAETNR
jgi:drug/metabolite transporter (DMT)-like permease